MNEVVTTGSQRRVLKSEKGWNAAFFEKLQHWSYLAIEDPIDPNHNVAAYISTPVINYPIIRNDDPS